MIRLKSKSASGVPIAIDLEQKLNGRGLVIGKESKVTVFYQDKPVFECKDTLEDAPQLKAILSALKEDKDIEGNPMVKPAEKPKSKTAKATGGEVNGDTAGV